MTGAMFWMLRLLPAIDRAVTLLEVSHLDAVNNALATYAATMAGFVSVIGTFVCAFKRNSYFRKYQRRGSFTDLMLSHLFSLVTMGVIFGLSLYSLAEPILVWPALCLAFGSMVQFGLLMIACYWLSVRAAPAEDSAE